MYSWKAFRSYFVCSTDITYVFFCFCYAPACQPMSGLNHRCLAWFCWFRCWLFDSFRTIYFAKPSIVKFSVEVDRPNNCPPFPRETGTWRLVQTWFCKYSTKVDQKAFMFMTNTNAFLWVYIVVLLLLVLHCLLKHVCRLCSWDPGTLTYWLPKSCTI